MARDRGLSALNARRFKATLADDHPLWAFCSFSSHRFTHICTAWVTKPHLHYPKCGVVACPLVLRLLPIVRRLVHTVRRKRTEREHLVERCLKVHLPEGDDSSQALGERASRPTPAATTCASRAARRRAPTEQRACLLHEESRARRRARARRREAPGDAVGCRERQHAVRPRSQGWPRSFPQWLGEVLDVTPAYEGWLIRFS